MGILHYLFVKHFIDLQFFEVGSRSCISFLQWCHICLILCGLCRLELVSVRLKKQTPSSSLYRLSLVGKDLLPTGLLLMGLLLGSQSSEVGSGHMAAGGQAFTKSSDGYGSCLVRGRWDCLQDLSQQSWSWNNGPFLGPQWSLQMVGLLPGVQMGMAPIWSLGGLPSCPWVGP